MKNLLFILFCCIGLTGCDNKSVDNIEVGMSAEEVIKVAGDPDEKASAGSGIDMNSGQEVPIEVWHYGEKQGVIFTKQQVVQIIPDMDEVTKELLEMKE